MNKRVLLFEAMDVINELLMFPNSRVTKRDALALLRRYKKMGGTLTYELTDPSDSVPDSVRSG